MMDGHSSYIIEHGIYFKTNRVCDYILYLINLRLQFRWVW